MSKTSRREFILMLGAGGVGLLAAACGGSAQPAPSSVVPAPSSAAPASKPLASTSGAASAPASNAAAPSSASAPASASTAASPASPKAGLINIKISDIQITSAAGSYIAVEKGYFKDEGISAELIQVPTVEQITAMLSGGVDVAGAALGPQLYNAMARGLSFKLVADHGSNLKNASAGGVIIRKDLVDSGKYKGAADMKGLNVFHPQPPTTGEIALEKYLNTGGLTLKDINTSPVQNFPDVIPAFSNKAVDAAYYQEPFSTIAVTQNLAVRGPIGYDIYPNQQIATLVANNKITGDLAIRYLRAYTRGIRDYVKAFIDKDQAMFDQVVPILIQHTTVKDRATYQKAIPSGLKADPVPNTQGILDDFQWFIGHGLINQKFDLAPYIDTAMVQEAIRQLGPASSASASSGPASSGPASSRPASSG